MPWETRSQKLHLPPKEKSQTYEQQVQAFYHRFGEFIDRDLLTKANRNSSHQTPQARYQQFMASLRDGSESDRSEVISIALAPQFLDIAFHFTQTGIINQDLEFGRIWDKVSIEAARQKQWDIVKKLLEQTSKKITLF